MEDRTKQILQKMEEFKLEMKQRKIDVQKIEHYKNFEWLNGLELQDSNVFIVKASNEEGRENGAIYLGDFSNLVGYIDENGNVELDETFLLTIQRFLEEMGMEEVRLEDLNLENLEGLNKENLDISFKERGDYEKARGTLDGSDEEKEILENEDEKKEPSTESESINNDLALNDGVDLKISSYKKINDKRVQDSIPEFKGKEEVGIAYSQALASYIIVEKGKDNRYKRMEQFAPAKKTSYEIKSLDQKREKATQIVPHALIKNTSNSSKELAVIIEPGGYIDLEDVTVTRSGRKNINTYKSWRRN